MKISRPFFVRFALLGGACLSLAFCPSMGHAQQAQPARSRPAAKPTAAPAAGHATPAPAPTARPTPTPPIIPPVPGQAGPEANEPSPPSDANDDAPVNETEIDATDGATFASQTRIAVFKGNVRVTDPRFQLACDKLTVFLNKTTAADAPAVPAAVGGGAAPKGSPAPGNTPPPLATGGQPATPGAKPAASPGGGGGGIDHVEAVGHVIILQKRAPTKPGEEEKVSVGRGEKGTFDNKTGDMVLYGMPSIEQNGNSHSATSPDTIMTIHKDSSLDTVGPSTTRLIQHKGSGAGIELPGVPAQPAAGGGGKPKKPKGNGTATSPARPPPANRVTAL